MLRKETVGGALLLVAAAIALVWANSPWGGAYETLRDTRVGPASLHLDLTLGTWAADGLLAIFFFVAGLELKREFVAGDLREPGRAALPVAAAVGGMAVPALLFVLVNLGAGDGALRGWAIPSATDIAFALAVLAVISTHLPTALRTFLLTLAVVDDLLAIVVIAIFYTEELSLGFLALSLVPAGAVRGAGAAAGAVAVAAAPARRARVGAHARVGRARHRRRGAAGLHGAGRRGRRSAEHFEHRIRPLSAGVAVPVFAFFSAGVAVGGLSGLGRLARATASRSASWSAWSPARRSASARRPGWSSRFTRAQLDENLGWPDVIGLALLGGIGFTVSLLITELAYGAGSERYDHAKVGILAGTLAAAAAGDRRAAAAQPPVPADPRRGAAGRRRRRDPRRLPVASRPSAES